MRKVDKFQIEFSSEQKIKMPEGAKILSVMVIKTKVFVVAEFSEHATETEDRTIATYTSGKRLIVMGSSKYVGTIVVEDVDYHVYCD